MAELVGCLAMSHAPQVMIDPDHWHLINVPRNHGPRAPELQNLSLEVKWERWNRCMDAISRLREALNELAPETVIVVGDDQNENLKSDAMPPFTIFVGEEAEASSSLKYLDETADQNRAHYRVDKKLADWLVDDLMELGFDPAYSVRTPYEGGLGHAFARVLKKLTPEAAYPIIPVMVNTYYPPAPSPRRCVQFGRALAESVSRFGEPRRVVVVGSGGLSHTDIDVELDHGFVRALESNDLEYMEEMPAKELIQGTSEIRCWIVTAAAADRPVTSIEYQPLPRADWGAGVGMGFASWRWE